MASLTATIAPGDVVGTGSLKCQSLGCRERRAERITVPTWAVPWPAGFGTNSRQIEVCKPHADELVRRYSAQ